MKINSRWHKENPMPDNATKQQRLMWHLAHQKHCNCRPMPKSIRDELANLK